MKLTQVILVCGNDSRGRAAGFSHQRGADRAREKVPQLPTEFQEERGRRVAVVE